MSEGRMTTWTFDVDIVISVNPSNDRGGVPVMKQNAKKWTISMDKRGGDVAQRSSTGDTLSFIASLSSDPELPNFDDFVEDEAVGTQTAATGRTPLPARWIQSNSAVSGSNSSTNPTESDSLPSEGRSNATPASSPAAAQDNFGSKVERISAGSTDNSGSDCGNMKSIEDESKENAERGIDAGAGKNRMNSTPAVVASKRDRWTSAHHLKCTNHPRWLNRL